MRALRRFVRRLAASATRRRDDARLRDEVEAHLALQTAENVRAGLSPVEARRQAVLKFGAVEAVKEQYRDEQGLPSLDGLVQDVRYTLRQWRQSPLFTVAATLSLAVGIGANAAVFTLVDRVLLRSLPVSNPEELVILTDQRSPAQPGPRFSYPFYADLRKNDVLTGLAAHFVLGVNATVNGSTARVRGALVSGNYFSVIGAGTQIGRPLTVEEDRTPGAHSVVVIADGLWRRSFGADPSALGRAIRINNHTYTIVGVAARDFAGIEVGAPVDAWIPLTMQREIGRDLLTDGRTNWLELVGRLKPGTTRERAGAELTAYIGDRADAVEPPGPARRLTLLPGGKGNWGVRRDLGPSLRLLLALTTLALVLASVNLASLLVVRSIAREREIAVRLALGAGRSRLARQFLTETLLLTALGGTAGLLLAPWAAGLLVASQGDRLGIDPSLDMRVLFFGLAISTLTGLCVGLAPIAAARRVDLARAFGASSAVTRGTHGRLSVHDVIVTGQTALSLAMLISAALLVQSLRNLNSVDLGFQADDLLLISIDPRAAGYEGPRLEGFWRDTLDRVSRIGGVHSVSVARTVPLAPGRQRQPVLNPASGERSEIDMNVVGPSYFRMLGIPLLRGREFGDHDGKASRPVVIVNERMAQSFWPEGDPIGKGFRTGRSNPMLEVVGVVKDVRYRDLRDAAGPMFYVPVFQTTSSDAMTLHVRAEADSRELAGTIRGEMQVLEPNLPLFAMGTLEDQLHAFLAQSRQAAFLTGGFGILALLLSGIGVYGVTALAISRQTRAIGIRMALGAQPRQIVGMLGRRGFVVIVTGLMLGLLGSLAFTRVAGALLFGVTTSDGATFVVMSALLAAVSLTAIYVPARAATRLNAVAAIRYE